jgi:hypothetical protein
MGKLFLGMALVMQSGAVAERAGEPKRAGVPMDAVALALDDVSQAAHHAPYFRYVWIPSGDKDEAAAVDVAVNTAISRSPLPIKGVRLGGNQLLRYDLRLLAPQDADLKRLTELWEQFEKNEPYFLIQGEAVKAVVIVTEESGIHTGEKSLGRVKPGESLEYLGDMTDAQDDWFRVRFAGGEGYILQSKAKKEATKTKARVMGPHCGEEAAQLVIATHSQVPIVRHDYFTRTVLSTLDGGLYYEFRGIEESPDENLSDIEHFLETFAGVTEADIAKLRSDQKVAMFRSQVTGKPRSVVMFSGAQGRISVNQGLVMITQDMRDADVDPLADPMLNLLKFKFPAIELFAEMQNGMLAYGLYTGDINGDGKYDPTHGEGELVRSAPDDIATDHTVPVPHTGRLQPAISCIRCHNTKRGELQPEGWLDLTNDVQTLLKSRLDVFGEKGDGFPNQDTIDRLAGLYAGDLSKPLRRARDDFSEAMLRLTGNPGDETASAVTVAHDRIVKTYHTYWYDLVTPEIACRELGFSVDGNPAAITLLKKLLPPLAPDELGIAPEDARLGALKAGVSINRLQWEAVYADAAARTINTLLEQGKP